MGANEIMVYRIYVEKKAEYAIEANGVKNDIHKTLGLNIELRLFNRYDVEGIDEEDFKKAQNIIFAEPPVDDIYYQLPEFDEPVKVLAVEFLPGQFDQRADSCGQCISLLTEKERPEVKSARVYALYGKINDEDYNKIKQFLINPVEAREASMDKPETLEQKFVIPESVAVIDGFTAFNEEELAKFIKDNGLAMEQEDIAFLQLYFKDTEKRDPTITEIKMIDTYWSDHCRHTTFSTEINKIDIKPDYVKKAFDLYMNCRRDINSKKKITLMDIATIGAKWLKKNNLLHDLDESEEINACSVKVKANIDGKPEDYLLMFKNETHNHPT
ncbi:MAG: phosphoribosylformylglycinamidine synthase, partial [Clostridia bacterium]|nr:phosphoribosylformylglycinamidine synthase [Clostridia bacterium]